MMEYSTQNTQGFHFWFYWRYFYFTVMFGSKACNFEACKVVRHKKETDVDADDDDDEEEGEKK